MVLGISLHPYSLRVNYQIAIIGGGLAGLALAIDLRKRSYQVVVIEKGVFPRHKVCGEYISMESHKYLFSLCPSLIKLQLPFINKFRLTSLGKKEYNTTLSLGGFGISRYLLEEMLYLEASRLGVSFMLQTKASDFSQPVEGSKFSINTNNGIVRASLICNATGRKSNFSTALKENQPLKTNYVGIKYHIKLNRDSDCIEIHNFPGGYCGISNIENDTTCLCYIVNSKKLNSVNNSIPELERTVLYQNSNLKSIFTTASFITPMPSTISGINFQIKKAVGDGIFFLGDAAGSIAPITGNGMSMALRSAAELANDIDQYFLNGTSLAQLQRNYELFWEQQFSSRVKLSRQFQKLSEQPRLTNFTINLFNAFPSLAQRIIKFTHGNPF